MTTENTQHTHEKIRAALSVADVGSSAIAYLNCIESENTIWRDRHIGRVTRCMHEILPQGGGFDHEWTIDVVRSRKTDARIVCSGGFHKMNENGYYDGWAYFDLILPASNIRQWRLVSRGGLDAPLREYVENCIGVAIGDLARLIDTLRTMLCVFTPQYLDRMIGTFSAIADDA